MSKDVMNPDCKVYVGNLPPETPRDILERKFKEVGPVKNVWIARNPTGFAFVEYEEQEDVSIVTIYLSIHHHSVLI
jgi:RNA recognition motif-containing protein